MASVCDVINTVSEFQLDALRKVNRKLISLQHLAALMEQLGDADAGFINELRAFADRFIPVSSIDATLYGQIQSACPFIALPPITADTSANTAILQAILLDAYNNLIRKVLGHAYSKMGTLQRELENFLATVAITEALAYDFFSCLQSACNGTLFTGEGAADFSAQSGQYQKNYVATGGKVLTPQQQVKNGYALDLLTKLQSLGGTAGVPYSQAKALLPATTSIVS